MHWKLLWISGAEGWQRFGLEQLLPVLFAMWLLLAVT